MYKELPVTLITGYLGSGKTTLLNNILKNEEGYKIAVIVNDIGEVNIDAELIAKSGVVSTMDDSLVSLQNGCICCSLNEDLIKQVCELVTKNKFDHIVIEASGICSPMPIVQSILAISEMCEQSGVPSMVRLDSIINVVDALRLTHEFGCGENLEKKKQDGEIENLIFNQLEFCNTIVLNKIDEVSKESLGQVKSVIKRIQPMAKIIETNFAKVDMKEMLDTNAFDFDKVAGSAGWIQEIEKEYEMDEHEHEKSEECNHHEDEHKCSCGHHHDDHECEHNHEHGEDCECGHHHEDGYECKCGHHHHDGKCETEEYGISTYVYHRKKPFDRAKWFEFMNKDWDKGLIRSKGLLYFSDEMELSYLFEQAGVQKNLEENGYWYASMPKEELDELFKQVPEIKKVWDEEYGDRLVKLVFIGQHLDKEKLKAELDKI